ncbi:two-component system sensor histidine kinase NtrB [Oryzomicrobium sp.]|uniref:two-component system sensor histidine kinase NtrB n=1 Tax=Oryzomicrobium sp. TaxID=1911578 RepID=UPI002FDF9A04
MSEYDSASAPPAAHQAPPPPSPWAGTYLLMPKLAMGLLVVSLISLLWILHRNEVDEQRATLIKDILWMEQNLRFHLSGVEDQLSQLSLDLSQDTAPDTTFQVRARHMVKNNLELEQVLWLDANGRPKAAVPTATTGRQILEPFGDTSVDSAVAYAFDAARKLGKPVYGQPYSVPLRGTEIELYVPVFRDSHVSGMLVGVFSLNSLLSSAVPWWFAEKYQFHILDSNGAVLAAKSNIVGDLGLDYRIPFDPPGQGLVLEAATYSSPGNMAQRVLAAVIVVLAAAVSWSLWAIRGHILRRLEAEQALREEHAFRKAMEDSMVVGMRARDMEGRIIYVNPAFCRMSGYSPDELIGTRPPMPYWDPEHMDMHEFQSTRVLTGKSPQEGFESRIRHKDGHMVHTMVYATPLIDASGKQRGWISSVFDITERKRIEALQRQQQEKLEQTARLVTMGEMASTMAHELNQPLSAIASYAAGCANMLRSEERAPDRQALLGVIEKLSAQAQRAGRVIRRIYDFVRKSAPQQEAVRLDEVAEEAVGFLEGEAKKRGVTLGLALPPGLPAVEGDRLLLGQVMINLLRNAVEAVSDQPLHRRRVQVVARVRDDQVEVRVEDTGPGIPTEQADSLFTPFYTTKAEGMGMGLPICRSIIESHHGNLRFEPRDGGGSVFAFRLPREGATMAPDAPPPAPNAQAAPAVQTLQTAQSTQPAPRDQTHHAAP